MRVDKYLADMGVGSRTEVKALIKKKQVTINGQLCKNGKEQVDEQKDCIAVSGQTISYQKFVYLMMNKPAGVISATEDNFQKTVLDLLNGEYAHLDLFPVGRLDKDTVGLLLLTNDGDLAHQLLSPKKHVDKTYFVKVAGYVTEEHVEAFSQGLTLKDGIKCQPAKLHILQTGENSEMELTLQEGKFHQVKRMVQAIGGKVTYLKRLSMGSLRLDPDLSEGEFRELSEEEYQDLAGKYKNE